MVVARLLAVSLSVATTSCTPLSTTLERQATAVKTAADLRVALTKAGDAANRAVMADTDEASATYAREAEQATAAAEKVSGELRPILTSLGYSREIELLDNFDKQFADYRVLDGDILRLAVENTNLKAQRISFGPARNAADDFAAALDRAAASARGADMWRAQALASRAVAAVREIEVLEAPHIAEADDEVMTRMEQEMAASEKQARDALAMLRTITPAAQLAAATGALDRFMGHNAQVITLSRRNSNVRSLALSLGRKRMLAASCDETLRVLQDTLAKHEFSATR